MRALHISPQCHHRVILGLYSASMDSQRRYLQQGYLVATSFTGDPSNIISSAPLVRVDMQCRPTGNAPLIFKPEQCGKSTRFSSDVSDHIRQALQSARNAHRRARPLAAEHGRRRRMDKLLLVHRLSRQAEYRTPGARPRASYAHRPELTRRQFLRC